MDDLGHRLEGPDDAPIVALASSLGTTSGMWDLVVPRLTDHLQVLRYDHPGHGQTPEPDGPLSVPVLATEVVDLLDSLDIERAHFCGLSLGAMVGMHLAATRPQRVDRLVLCCTSAHLPPAEAWHQRAETVRRDGMEAVADTVLSRWFTPGFRDGHPDVVAGARSMLTSTDPNGYAACCEAVGRHDERQRLADIAAATLVVAGADDEATPPSMGEAIADSVPDARLVVIDDAAHLAALEQPGAVADAILDHLVGSTDR